MFAPGVFYYRQAEPASVGKIMQCGAGAEPRAGGGAERGS